MRGGLLSKWSELFSYHVGVLMRIDGKKEFPRTITQQQWSKVRFLGSFLVTKIKMRSSHRLKKTEDQQTFKKSNFIRNVRGNARQKGKIQ